MTLQDPGNVDWYMDTGATTHLHADSSILNTFSNKCTNVLVLNGNASRIPVTHTDTTVLNQHRYRTLSLKNAVITPQILKNLIYVCQFTHYNKCSIKFDAFGLSVKDYQTHQILLRCDSRSDLYPVTAPSPQVLLSVSSSTWHQRLGYPALKYSII